MSKKQESKRKAVSTRSDQEQTDTMAAPKGIQLVPIGTLKANPTNQRLLLRDVPIDCQSCGVTFTSPKNCASRTPKFCSKPCYAHSLRKPKAPKVSARSRKGVPLPAEWRRALSDGRKRSAKCKGPNLYNWKGGAETYTERYRQHNRNRWQRMRAGGDLPLAYLSAVRRAQRDRCFYCDEPLGAGRATHIEHLTPISRGGTNEWDNLVYSCQPCNNSKRSKTLMEFAIHRMQPNLIDKSILIQCAAKRAVDRLIPRHASAVN